MLTRKTTVYRVRYVSHVYSRTSISFVYFLSLPSIPTSFLMFVSLITNQMRSLWLCPVVMRAKPDGKEHQKTIRLFMGVAGATRPRGPSVEAGRDTEVLVESHRYS